jgi:hypothetical protein
VILPHDAKQSPLDERGEIDDRMLELVAHGHDLAAAKQQVVHCLLDLQDVDVDDQVGKLPPQPLDRDAFRS